MPRREDAGPRPLSWSLDRVARSIRRVDVAGFGPIEEAWSSVRAAEASGAIPVRLERGVLVVAVASGAHAVRARRDAAEMLAQLSALVAEPPASVRVVVRS